MVIVSIFVKIFTSADRKQTVIGQLTNHNLCGMFYTLRNTLFINLYSAFTKFGTLPNSKVIQKKIKKSALMR